MAEAISLSFSFILLVEGPDLQESSRLDALAAAGCADATFSSCDGAQYAEFDREAATFGEALASAIADIRTAVPEVTSVQISAAHILDTVFADSFAEIGRMLREKDTEGLLKLSAPARRARAAASAARAQG